MRFARALLATSALALVAFAVAPTAAFADAVGLGEVLIGWALVIPLVLVIAIVALVMLGRIAARGRRDAAESAAEPTTAEPASEARDE